MIPRSLSDNAEMKRWIHASIAEVRAALGPDRSLAAEIDRAAPVLEVAEVRRVVLEADAAHDLPEGADALDLVAEGEHSIRLSPDLQVQLSAAGCSHITGLVAPVP